MTATSFKILAGAILLSCSVAPMLPASDLAEREARYYKLSTYELPEDLKLEASGLALLPDGKLAISIRKGEVWIADDPTSPTPEFTRFASGLHEPLGLAWHDGALYVAQRAEITKLVDSDEDGVADQYLTAGRGWGVSGNYHEYVYGPVFDPEGNMWVTLNQTLGKPVKMKGNNATEYPWRGWSMMKPKDGDKLLPMSAGLRSPSGIGLNAEGDVFATDQQGNWWGTNPLLHLRKGAYHGHADARRDMERPESPVADPGGPPKDITTAQAIEQVPGYTPPTVWFPYNKVGSSPTGLICDQTGGKFGPFEDQLLVGEFTYAAVSRVFLEKVGGEYQGACFKFREGMQSAVFSLAFLEDGSLVMGETNRGWNSLGTRSFGLERLEWTGEVPFEILKMEALSDGFRLTFTKPINPESVANVGDTFQMSSYTYDYHSTYGSDEVDTAELPVAAATVSEDALSLELKVGNLRTGYVHELLTSGIESADGEELLHPNGYYTLNRIPE